MEKYDSIPSAGGDAGKQLFPRIIDREIPPIYEYYFDNNIMSIFIRANCESKNKKSINLFFLDYAFPQHIFYRNLSHGREL